MYVACPLRHSNSGDTYIKLFWLLSGCYSYSMLEQEEASHEIDQTFLLHLTVCEGAMNMLPYMVCIWCGVGLHMYHCTQCTVVCADVLIRIIASSTPHIQVHNVLWWCVRMCSYVSLPPPLPTYRNTMCCDDVCGCGIDTWAFPWHHMHDLYCMSTSTDRTVWRTIVSKLLYRTGKVDNSRLQDVSCDIVYVCRILMY